MIKYPAISIDYTNHRGERSIRRVQPIEWWYGESPFHEGAQFFMKAQDITNPMLRWVKVRDFAMKDIHRFDCEPHLIQHD